MKKTYFRPQIVAISIGETMVQRASQDPQGGTGTGSQQGGGDSDDPWKQDQGGSGSTSGIGTGGDNLDDGCAKRRGVWDDYLW